MLGTLHKIIRVFLVVTPIIIFGWLAAKDIAPSGKIAAAYDMQKETPFISKLYPKDRVSGAVAAGDVIFYREILAEPVYFDLKPNGSFDKVAVTIKYENSGAAPLKIGGLINKDAWAFDWRNLPQSNGRWVSQTEIFDFDKLIPEGKKYRIGLSSAGAESGDIRIGEVKVLFVRPELDAKGVVNKIIEGMVWRVNKVF